MNSEPGERDAKRSHSMNQRKDRRRSIIYYLRVFDRDTDQMVGQLVDITTRGMKLVSVHPVDQGTRYSLRMLLPEEIDRKKHMNFEVECMWCKRDVNPNYFTLGFEFLDISPEDVHIIKALIYDFSFQN
jgi:hypothetical protein